jgi:hypothetical protein
MRNHQSSMSRQAEIEAAKEALQLKRWEKKLQSRPQP